MANLGNYPSSTPGWPWRDTMFMLVERGIFLKDFYSVKTSKTATPTSRLLRTTGSEFKSSSPTILFPISHWINRGCH